MDTSYEDWIAHLPSAVTADPMWRWEALRLAMWAGELAVRDERRVRASSAHRKVAEQLVTAAGSIAANLSEGASRTSAPDRARFVSYALGSAREAIAWYTQCRHLFPEPIYQDRVACLHSIRRLLTATLRNLHAQTETDARWKRKEG
jgi:four helix bundle protein